MSPGTPSSKWLIINHRLIAVAFSSWLLLPVYKPSSSSFMTICCPSVLQYLQALWIHTNPVFALSSLHNDHKFQRCPSSSRETWQPGWDQTTTGQVLFWLSNMLPSLKHFTKHLLSCLGPTKVQVHVLISCKDHGCPFWALTVFKATGLAGWGF